MTESEIMKTHLSFTIGPVQAFVGQARRTRDLWAGSWLLSYLAESALVAAEQAGGKTLIPFRSDEDCGSVTSKRTTIGGIPNRFELQFDSVETAKQAATAASDAFQSSWRNIASAVFSQFVEPVVEYGNRTAVIWNRQVESFWEITWVIGSPDGANKTLNHLVTSRKNIRNVNAQPEDGTKCSLMGTHQELSGYAGRGQRSDQSIFWNELRKLVPELDVQDRERLCAIALIKRLIPHVIERATGPDICDDLKQQKSWPSTAFLAALPWLRKVEESERARQAASDYAMAAKKAGWRESDVQAAKDAGLHASWTGLDGPAWFAEAVRQNEPGASKDEVCKLLELLNNVQFAVPGFQPERSPSHPSRRADVPIGPVPYYALLLMDGDSMGRLVATLGSPEKVSRGLNRFAGRVDKTVQSKLGRTIYTGGDDVMAILPAANALHTADELAREYVVSFQHVHEGKTIPDATLSGAIIYAHWKYPLRQVLQTAHHLLDDVAKERTGRDSLAIGIVQGSGLQAVWSAPWSAVRGETGNVAGFGKLDELIDRFGSDSTRKETTEFNGSFLYLLRKQFGKLFAEPIEQPGQFGRIGFGDELLTDIANAEYRRRMTREARKKVVPSETKNMVRPLLAISQPWTRDPETRRVRSDPQAFSFDGWRVARFLKQVKDGKVDGHA